MGLASALASGDPVPLSDASPIRGGGGLRDWRNWLTLVVSCGVLVAVFVLAEWMASTPGPEARVKNSTDFSRFSEVMGWEPIPSSSGISTKFREHEVLYEVNYAFDAEGRRQSPEGNDGDYERFLLFFGGSNTFGEGVAPNETLPYLTARSLPGVRSYNYAYRGYGMQHMLARLDRDDLRSQVEEPRGLAVYVYFGFHMGRLIGSSHDLRWARNMPYYRREDGVPVHGGLFEAARPIYTWAVRRLDRSSLMKRLNIRWPPRVSDADLEFACLVLATARERLREQFGDTELVIALHPTYWEPALPCLEDVGLPSVDLRQAFHGMQRDEHTIPNDGHTSGGGNAVLAEILAREIQPLF